MGLGRIFRSRWSALFWAGGVLWTAYDVASANAPDPRHKHDASAALPTDATGATISNDDLAAVGNAMGL